ncbi:topless-related protein 2-like, partial [Trifolium medium]|nr:topless-related protein 2-like [Trifolium medium]
AAIVKDASISVTRVSWSPDGNLLGVAFTKHLIHLYGYHGSNDLRQTLEACHEAPVYSVCPHQKENIQDDAN